MKLVALRIVVDGLVPLEPTVHAHEADAIFDAWLGDAPEVVIPAANGATLPLTREEIRTIETIREWAVGPDGLAVDQRVRSDRVESSRRDGPTVLTIGPEQPPPGLLEFR